MVHMKALSFLCTYFIPRYGYISSDMKTQKFPPKSTVLWCPVAVSEYWL
jgi:hypothetical protein